ncbi:MAG TPA: maleylpyruvate isomerase family mycothiol-dependent enzyme [Pseudonocardia sp.]|jgi:uncharacterized protein (TIGR03083 family)|nr:maleylpyruvate isomerase family mycothiol-dependent enzyme [Pseudonocardia sp.]
MTMTEQRPSRSPRRSAFDRASATRLAATEYDRYLDQLRSLTPDEWRLPTDCPAWDVRAMATHNLGMAEMVTSMREYVRQNAGAARQGGEFIDALTGNQVRERIDLSPEQILERYAAVAPRAARGRRRRSVQMGRVPMPVTQPLNGADERWAFGFIFDTILTRDTWMHRVDTAQTTRRAMALTAEHDGVIIADVVAEWAARHGAACALTLTGPAGGHWRFGTDGPELELDAVQFCRILARRSPGEALLDTEVPF